LNAKPVLSFREQYGPRSSAWTEGHFPPIVRFWIDDGSCWGVAFHQVIAVNYNPRSQTLLIHCSLGSILVTGPQAEAFLERLLHWSKRTERTSCASVWRINRGRAKSDQGFAGSR